MAIYFGNDNIKEIYVGSDKIKEVYYGSELVYTAFDPRGYWVHKDTGVKTYFGLDDPSITDGIMNRPSWASNCSEVKIPSGVTGLGDGCFNQCFLLTSVILPESVTSLGIQCFEWSPITSINLPVGITILGHKCFDGCAFSSIILPEGVTSLGGYCFHDCYFLTSITIPESVTSIGENCFKYCSNLTLATVLPSTPPTLGGGAFDNVHSSFNIKVRSPYVDAYKAATNWKNYASKISAI